ncbi:hypothetical protein EDB84DRAFT_1571381 [Lactarius hengduanensis]|nr:hypothetical protein EDB84DRAFT_1571381 [Lactarius hengduanensis]
MSLLLTLVTLAAAFVPLPMDTWHLAGPPLAWDERHGIRIKPGARRFSRQLHVFLRNEGDGSRVLESLPHPTESHLEVEAVADELARKTTFPTAPSLPPAAVAHERRCRVTAAAPAVIVDVVVDRAVNAVVVDVDGVDVDGVDVDGVDVVGVDVVVLGVVVVDHGGGCRRSRCCRVRLALPSPSCRHLAKTAVVDP